MIFIGLVLFTSALVSVSSEGVVQKKRPNRPPAIQSITVSQHVLSLCPFALYGVCGPPDIIISVNASDPDGDKLQFNCEVLAGKLSKCGPEMSWDLTRVVRMEHKFTVRVSDGRGGEDQSSTSVTVADCTACDPPPPPCPYILLSTSTLSKNETQVTCTLKLNRGESIGKPGFHWKLSAGKILRGEDTNTIVIDTTGVDEEALKVEVTVSGLDPSCSNTATERLLLKRN